MSRYATYDPLTARRTPVGHDAKANSYWRAHPVSNSPPVPSVALPQRAQTVIIGAGYTGLNAALELAAQGEDDIVVIDAGEIGAGCSSRNAGFILPASGRLSLADYAQQFGERVAEGVLNEFNLGVQHIESLVGQHAIACDYASARYLRIAHHPSEVGKLASLAASDAPWPRKFLDAGVIQQQLPGVQHAFAALQQQPAGRVHPLALVKGYAQAATQAGVKFVTQCAALQITPQQDKVTVTTSGGEISAHTLLLCTNAYATRSLLKDTASRQLPVLSNVAVTEPLTDWQINQLGLTPDDLVMDTRRLKYYYRLLADKRLLFGGRGAVSGRNALHPKYAQQLHRAMTMTLPVLRDTQFDYQWSGWVSVALDAYPRVFSHSPRVHASFGYCGAGIAFASLAGKRLAQLATAKPLPALPFYQSAPPPFPFPGLRRTAQRVYYQYAKARDRYG